MAIQDSRLYTGRTGTGLSDKKRHSKTATGYCRSCKSNKCYMTAYVPKYDHIWTWEEIYNHTVNTYSKEED